MGECGGIRATIRWARKRWECDRASVGCEDARARVCGPGCHDQGVEVSRPGAVC